MRLPLVLIKTSYLVVISKRNVLKIDDDEEYILTEDKLEHEDEILHQQVNIFYRIQLRF